MTKMEAEETNSFDEEMEEIVMWSITGVLVAVLVIVTIVVVRCIWKSTPAETDSVNHVGTKSDPDWKSRVVEYYRGWTGYWKVTDPDAPKWDPNRPKTGTYTEVPIRSTREAKEAREAIEMANRDDGIYSSGGKVNYIDMN